MSDRAGPSGPPRVETTTVRVRYAETDRQGIVYHANYFVWMELGRTDFLRKSGFPYPDLEAAGIVFAVSEARCRFRGAAEYDDEVEVATRVREVRSRSVVFEYELRAGERPLASGETTLVALDVERRPRRIPDELRAALRR